MILSIFSIALIIQGFVCFSKQEVSHQCIDFPSFATKSHCTQYLGLTNFSLILNYPKQCHSSQRLAPRSLIFGTFLPHSECDDYYKTNQQHTDASLNEQCCKTNINGSCYSYLIPITRDQNDIMSVKDQIAKRCTGVLGNQLQNCNFNFSRFHLPSSPFQYVSFAVDCIDKSTIFDLGSSSSPVSGQNVSFYFDSRGNTAMKQYCSVFSENCYENIILRVSSNGASCNITVDKQQKLVCGDDNRKNQMTIGSGQSHYYIEIEVGPDSSTPVLWIEAKGKKHSQLRANCSDTPLTITQTCTTTTAKTTKSSRTQTSTNTVTIEMMAETNSKGGIGAGGIAGIITGVIVLAGCCTGAFLFYRHRQKIHAASDVPKETQKNTVNNDPKDVLMNKTDTIVGKMPAGTTLPQ